MQTGKLLVKSSKDIRNCYDREAFPGERGGNNHLRHFRLST